MQERQKKLLRSLGASRNWRPEVSMSTIDDARSGDRKIPIAASPPFRRPRFDGVLLDTAARLTKHRQDIQFEACTSTTD